MAVKPFTSVVLPMGMLLRHLPVPLLCAVCLSVGACGSPAKTADSQEPSGAGSSATLDRGRANDALIPRTLLFGNPDRAGANLSPDGERLMFRAPVDGVLNVWVGPADDPDAAKPVTRDTKRGIRVAGWSADGKWVLYGQDEAGDENWHVHRVDPTTGEDVDLTPYAGARAEMIKGAEAFPGTILVGLNDRDPQMFDLYRLDIATGERTLLFENTVGHMGWTADEQLKLRYAYGATPEGGRTVFRAEGEGDKLSWVEDSTILAADALATRDIGFDRSGRYRYMLDSRGRETAALVEQDTQTGDSRVLFEDPKADVSWVMRDAEKLMPVAVSVHWDKPRWEVLDPSVEADFAYLKGLESGTFAVSDQSRDDRKWIITYYVDDGPAKYYLYDRDAKQAKFLFTTQSELEKLDLAKMHALVIPSRDGLELVSYLSLPPASDADEDGRPDQPLPMVLFVHGGPWARDYWGYNPYHQWLANRGYAVLSVNFRGSTGLGKSFTSAGDKEWAAAMHNDLLDAVNWAVDEGVAKRDSVAIMGGSYGGYATLVGLTFTPEVFACGVDIVGPSNLVTLLKSIPPYWAPMLAQFKLRVGDHKTGEGREFLMSRSPVTKVDEIVRPLLIGQGANDPRVKQAESDQIVAAMQERSIPVTYVLFPDEGHGFARPENNQAFNAVTESFLAGCLGGEYLPFDSFEGSSITVPVGAEHVPGLSEALSRD